MLTDYSQVNKIDMEEDKTLWKECGYLKTYGARKYFSVLKCDLSDLCIFKVECKKV